MPQRATVSISRRASSARRRLCHGPQRIDRGRPLPGICLGARLMARAPGAAVTPMRLEAIGDGSFTFTPEGAGLSQVLDAVSTDGCSRLRL